MYRSATGNVACKIYMHRNGRLAGRKGQIGHGASFWTRSTGDIVMCNASSAGQLHTN